MNVSVGKQEVDERNVVYLHRTTAELIVQLGAKNCTGPDLILTGVRPLPDKNQILEIRRPLHF